MLQHFKSAMTYTDIKYMPQGSSQNESGEIQSI